MPKIVTSHDVLAAILDQLTNSAEGRLKLSLDERQVLEDTLRELVNGEARGIGVEWLVRPASWSATTY